MERMSIRASALKAGDRIIRHEYNFHADGAVVEKVGAVDSAHFVHVHVAARPGRRNVIHLSEGSQVEVAR